MHELVAELQQHLDRFDEVSRCLERWNDGDEEKADALVGHVGL